ncbi:MAG: F0F1 ATP synthase subunit A, partial [Pseudomonadota bacterium]
MADAAGGSPSPLDQFLIKTIIPFEVGGVDVSYTNSALAMTVAVVAVSAFLIFGMRRGAVIPCRWQLLAEIGYEFVANMIRDNVGQEGRRYFPFIFTLFMFVLAGNMIGMIPYSFTFTSHLIVTFGLAAVVFIGVTIIGFAKHGFKFFGFFLPHGVPWFLAWLIIPIEILSYLSRPVSLSLRLFANMTAGHTMLKVFAGFIFVLGALGLAPFLMVVALTGFK